MSSREIIDLILGKYKTKCGTLSSFVSNDNLSSFYISQQRSNNLPPVQIRLSNHGTYLRTWVDRVNLNNSKGRLFNPSHCINISIVFLDEDSDLTNDCEGQINCDDCQITPCIPQTFEGQNELGHSFTVYQFVYKSKCIKRRYIDGIVNAIISALKQGVYKDSLANIEQKASTKELKSNYTPQNTSVNKNKTNENKEYKINKNMKKQVIRLTESDLKNIIKESVNNILSELDWKTYQNARGKAIKRGEYDRALKFGDAAQKSFSKEYDTDGVDGNIFLNRVSAESDDYPSHTLMHLYNYDEEGNPIKAYNYDNTKAFGLMDKYDKEGRYKRVKNPSLKRFFNNPEREKAYKRASKEMDNYMMGNYDYIRDKGWVNK